MSESLDDNSIEPIAIVGMACRFPGAPDLESFWRNLRNGVESIRFFSEDELRAAGVEESLYRQPGYVPAHGKLDGIENFDAEFFGFSPREAEIMDPQHRLFLECAWTAIEHSGHNPDTVGERFGVVAGVGLNAYLLHNILPRRDLASAANFYSLFVANDKDFLPMRVSYKLNLRGPSLNVNTACSSSLVAIHVACQQLWSYQCDAVLAGGCSLQVPQDAGYLHQEGGIASADGHCRAFDAAAGGTVTGSGVGVVVLKRLSDAVAAGDTVHALIRGTGCNNDGAHKAGFTAPSIDGQAAAIAEAQAMAGVDPESIAYIEAHGTGTALGDPIEIAALTQAFGTDRRQYCLIGSVKTNIGHLDTAAGVAGLIKTVLALKHQAIPPSLHYRAPNAKIDFAMTPFKVCAELTAWPKGKTPRRGGVSSFGIGGTNAHVVVEEAPPLSCERDERPRLLVLSARTPPTLARQQANMEKFLVDTTTACRDLAWTACQGRKTFAETSYAVLAGHGAPVAFAPSVRRPADPPRVAFLFPGQGAQQAGAGRQLHADEPVFRQAFDRCLDALIAAGAPDLRPLLLQAPSPAADDTLRQTRYAQPALFVLGVALAALWRHRGIEPHAVLGHSAGEYAAAVCAGILTVEDGARALAARAHLMAALPPGAMAAVGLPEAELARELVGSSLVIAAVNAGALCTVAGDVESIGGLERRLAERGVFVRRLNTAHAFHSPAVEPMLEDFRQALAGIRFCPPTVLFYSAVLGAQATAEQACDPELWVRQIRQPVRFGPALDALAADGRTALVEVGPGNTLAALAKNAPAAAIVAGVSAADARRDMLDALGRLWQAGAAPRWESLFEGESPRRVPMPTYPFEPSRHWVSPRPPGTTALPVAATGNTRDLERWFYVPTWRRGTRRPATAETGQRCLVLGDGQCGRALAAELTLRGIEVIAVGSGSALSLGPEALRIRDGVEADYDALFDHLQATGKLPDRIVVTWATDGSGTEPVFSGLLRLARAVGRRRSAVEEIAVITRGLAAVLEKDAIDPAQALLLGPLLVIPTEFPGLACRAIDLEPAVEPAGAALAAADELLSPTASPLVALRGRQRWLPDFDAVPLPAAPGSPFRVGGTYLITGGTGGIGLHLAAHLAKSARARLVLTTRRPLPPAEDWPRLAATANHCIAQRLDDLAQFLNAREAAIETELAIRTVEQRPGLREAGNCLTAAHAIEYLRRHGIMLNKGRSLAADDIAKTCGVLPEFIRLLNHLLNVLIDQGWLERDGPTVTARRDFAEAPAAGTLHAEVCVRYPTIAAEFEMLSECVRKYPEALSGRIPAISVLYPDGERYVIAEAAARTEEHGNHRVYRVLLADLLHDLARRAETGRPLRIIEVGGGNAIMTAIIAERLRGLPVEYHFTDIGRSFVQAAEAKARDLGYDFIRFATFDISRDPAPQGFAPGTFDAVIGLDVVHATPSIRATIANLRQLLVPGGLLALVESARTERWNDMVFGLAEGWWYAQDAELRNPHSPLLSTGRWETALEGCGFSARLALPVAADKRACTDCSLILAQNGEPLGETGGGDAQLLASLLAIQRDAEDLLVCEADVGDQARMESVVALAEERFGPIHGVFHAAATEAKAVIAAREEPFAAAELRPKVDGAGVLDAVFRPRKLDFMALFSSITGTLGGAGQVGYCAANAFLDAFAERRMQVRDELTVSIAWGRWQGVGLARDFEAWHAAQTGRELQGGMTPDEGIEALGRILAHRPGPRVVVMSSEWRPDRLDSTRTPGDAHAVDAALQARIDPPHANDEHVFDGTPTEQRLAAIWRQLLGTSRFDRQTSFQELGGDSLVGIQMITRIKEQTGVQLPIHSIFDCPTIAALAARIDAAATPMEEGLL